MRKIYVITRGMIAMLWAPVATALGQPSFFAVPSPPGVYAYAWSISADGTTVVGQLLDPGAATAGAFRWRVGHPLQVLPPPPTGLVEPAALDVSGNGDVVVGAAYASGTGAAVPFRFTGKSGYELIATVQPRPPQLATSTSDDGRWVLVTGANDTISPDSAYLVSRDAPLTTIGPFGDPPEIWANAISGDGTTVVGGGFPYVVQGRGAFRWRASSGIVELTGLPGGTIASMAFGVSTDGSVVVGASDSANVEIPGYYEACRWGANGDVLGLGDIGGGDFASIALGVSGDGSIIVGSGLGDDGGVAFIWDAVHGLRSLQALLVELGLGEELAGWSLSSASAVSADGRRICGLATSPTGLPAAWVADLGRLPCRSDFNRDGLTDTRDFFDFIAAFFGSAPRADFNDDGLINSQDFFDFLAAFFAGC